MSLVDDDDRVVLEFELNEGRNRQIRKMCESVGLEVARLKRVAVGNLRLRTASRWKMAAARKQGNQGSYYPFKAQGGNNMSVKEQISKLKDLSGSSAMQRILSLCDEGSFSEIGEFTKAVTGFARPFADLRLSAARNIRFCPKPRRFGRNNGACAG